MIDLVAKIATMALMAHEKASVAQAKNTLSSLINKVAYGKVRILLESRGKPKAALVSTDDLARLERLEQGQQADGTRLQLLAQARSLRKKILARRKRPLTDSVKALERVRNERDRGLSGMRRR
jgi:prevent-host-death family protein